MRSSSRVEARMFAVAALCIVTASAWGAPPADTAPMTQTLVPLFVDSGPVVSSPRSMGVAFTHIVHVPGRASLRLRFTAASLGAAPAGAPTTFLRLTSLLDGGVQTLDQAQLAQWQCTSAYFNGDAVLLEIVAHPSSAPSRVAIEEVVVGEFMEPSEGGVSSLCLGADDRTLSLSKAIGRMVPEGCTTWIFDDANHTLLSAGHCYATSTTVIEFNAPLSAADGTPVHSDPSDQYIVDGASLQGTYVWVGNDWAYFGCHPNPVTGMTPFERQREFFVLNDSAPALDDPPQVIRVAGYGTTFPPANPTWNQALTEHEGSYGGVVGSVASHHADTTPGDSGAPMIELGSNKVVGIHTHGGCDDQNLANRGTAIEYPALQAALAHPTGVCLPSPGLGFEFPDGQPDHFAPAGATLRVNLLPGPAGMPQEGSAQVMLDSGSGFAAVETTHIGGNQYTAAIAPTPCTTPLKYYIKASTTEGQAVAYPVLAPSSWLAAVSADVALDAAFHDTFETDLGWTVTNIGTLTAGAWERVTPTATGFYVPVGDADGSGMCYVTGNAQGEDVDGESTILTSPLLDATALGARLEYWYCHHTSSTLNDFFHAEVSFDGGTNWTVVAGALNSDSLWRFKSILLEEEDGYVPTNQFRVRFISKDYGSDGSVESGVDGVAITSIQCLVPCLGDLDGSGDVNGADLGILLGTWGHPGASDFNHDGTTNGADLGVLLGAWGNCGQP